jgi:hypothetical protein
LVILNKIKVILIIIVIVGLLWFFSALFSDISKESLMPEFENGGNYSKGFYEDLSVFGNRTNTSLILKVLYPYSNEVLTFFIESDTIEYMIIDSNLNRVKEDFLRYYRRSEYE